MKINSIFSMLYLLRIFFTIAWITIGSLSRACVTSRQYAIPSQFPSKPSLILITGCTGTGKSTFGMSLALNQRILKCISTDTVRQVMRTMDPTTPALHRSSYQGEKNAVESWKEASEVIEGGITGLVTDSMNRGVSLVLEGVHIIPDNELLDMWRANAGPALGIVLKIPNAQDHKDLIVKRGDTTTKANADKQVEKFNRIREIHDEMLRLGELNKWLVLETKLKRDPVEIVSSILNHPDNLNILM